MFSFADVPLARPEEKTLGLKNAQECENFRFKNNFGFSEQKGFFVNFTVVKFTVSIQNIPFLLENIYCCNIYYVCII